MPVLRTCFVGSLLLLLLLTQAVGCAEQHENPAISGHDIRLAFLHTSDIHARILPYRMEVILTDEELGLAQENEPFGGIARIAHIIRRERARGPRVLFVDTGDYFQGAPSFNAFMGEAETRAMSELRPDVVAVGNHEFDTGLSNYAYQLAKRSTFPSLAANYLFEEDNPLKRLVEPYSIVQVGGVKVGVIGVGDFSSLSSITDVGNSLHIIPLNIEQSVQEWIDILRPTVDLIAIASHAGLHRDEQLIRCTTGIDVLFGGHLHIVLEPPKVVQDAAGRNVPIVHSGAFAKFVGRLDTVLRRAPADYCCEPGSAGCRREEYALAGQAYDCVGLELASHDYELFPVDATVPNDPTMLQLMEEYRLRLNQKVDLTGVFAYTARILTKYGYGGGSSSLGNLVAETMRQYARVDIGFTNTLGIRSNMNPGPVTQDDLYNIFPFNNTITTLYMSGEDLQALFDYNTRRSAGRGCVGQLQVSGIQFTMNCKMPPPECRCTAERDVCPGTIGLTYANEVDCGPGADLRLDDVLDDGRTRLEHCAAAAGCELTDTCDNLCVCPAEAQWISQCRCPPLAQDIYVTDCSNPAAGIQTLCTDLAQRLGPEAAGDLILRDPQTDCACTRIDHPAGRALVFEVATNDYIAHGGSGFTILRANTTQVDTGLPMREAVLEELVRSPKCIEDCRSDDGRLSIASCYTYGTCVADVAAYWASYCDHADETTYGESDTVGDNQCAVDLGICESDEDCHDPAESCREGGCRTCRFPVDCLDLGTEDVEFNCYGGRCQPARFRCVRGRCLARCTQNSDCPRFDEAPAGQRVCLNGTCMPAQDGFCVDAADCSPGLKLCHGEAPPCDVDRDCEGAGAGLVCVSRLCVPERRSCTDETGCDAGETCAFGYCAEAVTACANDGDCPAGGACRGGLCSGPCGSCSEDAHCPNGLVCSQGYCIAPLVDCVDHQCRGSCASNVDCLIGAVCKAGHCVPAVCERAVTAGEACRLRAQWRAREECLRLPCPQALEDGRISRILPENLADLPDDPPANDPEDIDDTIEAY